MIKLDINVLTDLGFLKQIHKTCNNSDTGEKLIHSRLLIIAFIFRNYQNLFFEPMKYYCIIGDNFIHNHS